jgi:hypothetical protein
MPSPAVCSPHWKWALPTLAPICLGGRRLPEEGESVWNRSRPIRGHVGCDERASPQASSVAVMS